jgi:parvulin-like peptidyl-prolyl isomerase
VGLAQILLQGSDEEIQQQVSTIRKSFKSGITFEELSKLHSADINAKRTGGKLGIFKPEDLLPEIGAATKSLKRGEISNVVQTSIGNHLLYIYEEQFPQDLDCTYLSEDQNNKYSNALYSEKRAALLDTYMSELYACAHVEIKDPGTSGLPALSALPEVEKGNVNCQARRVMVLPQKKKKGEKRIKR